MAALLAAAGGAEAAAWHGSNARAGAPFLALCCQLSFVSPNAEPGARLVGVHRAPRRPHPHMSAQTGSQRLRDRGQSALQRRMGWHGAEPSWLSPLPPLRGVHRFFWALAAGSLPWFSGPRAPIPRRRTLPLPPRPGGDGADRSPPARGCAALRAQVRQTVAGSRRSRRDVAQCCVPHGGQRDAGERFFYKARAGGVRVQSQLASQCCGAGGLAERPQCREAVRQAFIACPALSRVSVGAALTLHPHPACPRQMGRIAARAALPCAAGPGGRGLAGLALPNPRAPRALQRNTQRVSSHAQYIASGAARRAAATEGGTLIASAGLSAL